MSEKASVISDFDRTRLEELIEELKGRGTGHPWVNGEKLLKKLASAQVVTPAEVPADAASLNSIVRLRDLESNTERVYNLVFPSHSNPREGRISVLSSLGVSMLGCRIGEVVEWETPKGLKLLRIVEVIYQPEAAGHWTL